jgi:hypothetical protein
MACCFSNERHANKNTIMRPTSLFRFGLGAQIMIKKLILLIITFIYSTHGYSSDLISFIICHYESYSDKTGNNNSKEEFKLEFLVDSENGDYYLKGSEGIGKITFIKSIEGFNFIEKTGSGNIMLTTIDAEGHSVHSRHTIILGKIVPSQYYGSCQIRK